jgi:hypothetical protein
MKYSNARLYFTLDLLIIILIACQNSDNNNKQEKRSWLEAMTISRLREAGAMIIA